MMAPLNIASLMVACLAVWAVRGDEFKVDSTRHHLLLKGKPFFWLADTVWLLAQVPSRDDLEVYLAAREKQGFTVIQLTAVMSAQSPRQAFAAPSIS